MHGQNRTILPGTTCNPTGSFQPISTGKRRSFAFASGEKVRAGWLRPTGPGFLPGLTIRASSSVNDARSPAPKGPAPVQPELETTGHAGDAVNRPTRAMPPKYKVADDPLLRQSQMLLEASRRLREQPLVPTSVDHGRGPALTNGASNLSDAQQLPTPAAQGLNNPQDAVASGQASMPSTRTADTDILASFGNLAAASATAAARLTAARITAASATVGPIPTTSAPPAANPVTTTKPAFGVAVAVTATAAGAVVVPPAANATAATAALNAASSTWLAIEELLEEAAYSLSQDLPGGRASSPLDALTAATASGPSGALTGPSSAASALADGLALQLPSGAAALPSALPNPAEVLSAVPGADRLSELLDDLLYSLSQDINLATTSDAVVSAAAAAAAGLAEAAAELPRAAVAIYRSAADAASTAAAARSATRGYVGSSSGYILPEGVEPPAPGDPGWDPYGTIRAALGLREEGPAPSDLEAAVAEAGASLAAVTPAADAAKAAAAVAGPAVVAPAVPVVPPVPVAPPAPVAPPPPPPVVIAPEAATTLADAATATADSVVQAATTAAAGTVVIAPPPTPVPVVPTPPPIMPPAAVIPAPPAVTIAPAPAPVPAPAPAPVPAPPAVATAPAPPVPSPAPAPVEAAVPPPTAVAPAPLPSVAEVTPPPAAPATVSIPPVPAVPEPAAATELLPPVPEVVAEAVPYTDYSATAAPDALDGLDVPEMDQLTAALQSLLGMEDGVPIDGLDLDLMDPATAASSLADAATSLPEGAEEAVATLSEALRRELGAVVGSDLMTDVDPTALAQAAGQAVGSALSSLPPDMASLPPDVRLSSLLGATLQSSMDLVEAALGGVRSADSELVGGITIAAVLAVLLRAVVSMAGSALSRSRVSVGVPGAGLAGVAGATAGDASDGPRLRPVGVTALEAAAALNNDVKAILLDIRNGSDVMDQGLPDLRPFRRGAGLAVVSLPYCDYRTVPTLSNPSGSLLASSAAAAGGSSSALAPSVTVAVDPQFTARFKQLSVLDRDSRVFLLDSYGVEAPEAVKLLRSDAEIERLLGAQGVKYVEGGFAGPEGWKLTGLPVADPPTTEAGSPAQQAAGPLRGLDLTGLLSGVAGLRVRYPSLFSRTVAVGAVGGAGVAVASQLDWGAVSRGAVGLAATMLLADRALPPGVRPSGKLREYLQAQLTQAEAGAGSNTSAEDASRRRRTALLLRALDLAEAVGDAVVRVGGAAVAAAGTAARFAADIATSSPVPAAPASSPLPLPAGAPLASETTNGVSPVAADIEAELDITPPPQPSAPNTQTIVLPHGMDSPQWSDAAEAAVPVVSQQQPLGRSGSPVVRTRSPSRAASPTSRSTVASNGTAGDLLPPRAPSPSLAGRLGSAIRSAADAVVRAASPARSGSGSRGNTSELAPASSPPAPRAPSPGVSGGSKGPDTMELMQALATASALSNTTLPGAGAPGSSLPAGWPASSFPRASSGQGSDASVDQEEDVEAVEARRLAEEQARVDAALAAAAAALGEEPAPAPTSAAASSSSSTASAWANWRQELDVAPPPPAIESLLGGRGAMPPSDVADVGDVTAGEGAGSASLAASRLGGSSGGLSPGRRRSNSNNASSSSSSRVQRRPLRTSSPERAAAAAAAMQRLRLEVSDRDDDGLGSAVYGSAADQLIGDDPSSFAKQPLPEVDVATAKAAAAAANVTAPAERAGSAGMAAARLARGNGGLSPGRQRGGQQQQRTAGLPAQEPVVASGGSGRRQQNQRLRTASPERAATAAAAMRQLRREMGLPPNDGDASDRSRLPVAVAPRDWRRELEAAAEMTTDSQDSEDEPVVPMVPPEALRSPSGERAATVAAVVAAAAAAPPPPLQGPAAPAPSRSPRNWRDQLQGSRAAPSDWRTRIESGVGAGEREPVGAAAGAAKPLRTVTSPGRAKLTAAERAERDARLQDWRARV